MSVGVSVERNQIEVTFLITVLKSVNLTFGFDPEPSNFDHTFWTINSIIVKRCRQTLITHS